jgi:hypothetical protein
MRHLLSAIRRPSYNNINDKPSKKPSGGVFPRIARPLNLWFKYKDLARVTAYEHNLSLRHKFEPIHAMLLPLQHDHLRLNTPLGQTNGVNR